MLSLIRHKKGKTRKERDREREGMSSRESSQERQEQRDAVERLASI